MRITVGSSENGPSRLTPMSSTSFDASGLAGRAEAYGPDDLPEAVQAVTGFADVQGDRLEVQLVGWGAEEEAWPFLYEVIREDPVRPTAWRELDALFRRSFTRRDGRVLRIGAFGIDTGGHHTAQVFSFCRQRPRARVFPCKGMAGNKAAVADGVDAIEVERQAVDARRRCGQRRALCAPRD